MSDKLNGVIKPVRAKAFNSEVGKGLIVLFAIAGLAGIDQVYPFVGSSFCDGDEVFNMGISAIFEGFATIVAFVFLYGQQDFKV